MRIRSAIMTVIMAFGPAFGAFAAVPPGIQFSAPDGRISIWAPALPKVSQEKFPSRTGSPYQRTTYAVGAANGLLLAGVLDFRGDLPTTGEEQSYLDTMLKSLASAFGPSFKLTTEGQRNITLSGSGLPGRELVGTLQDQRIVFRAYVGKSSIYMLEAGCSQSDKDMIATADRFLSSLVVLRDQ